MDTDIRDELDRCFDEGPPVGDLDLLLSRGRAVLRRRRVTESAAALLVVGVVAGLALAFSGSTVGSSSPAPAGTTFPDPKPVEDDPTLVRLQRPFLDFWEGQRHGSLLVVPPDSPVGAGARATFRVIVTHSSGRPVEAP